jgi:hypothetical protein
MLAQKQTGTHHKTHPPEKGEKKEGHLLMR